MSGQQTEKMTVQIKYLVFLILFFISCTGREGKKRDSDETQINQEQHVDTPKIEVPKQVKNTRFDEIIHAVPFKKVPLVDSTNFDNFNTSTFYNKEEISVLQLDKIYPEFYEEGYFYRASSSYKIEMSDKFHSIVITTYRGEHEMESTLVNYDLNGKLIDFKVTSYDEIAEGWSTITSKIEKNKLTITNTLWLDEKQEIIERFEINADGKINPVSNTVKD